MIRTDYFDKAVRWSILKQRVKYKTMLIEMLKNTYVNKERCL